MYPFSRSLSLLAGLASLQCVLLAQSVGPQLSVSPGVIASVVSRTNNLLQGDPDSTGIVITPRFNGLAFRNTANGPTVYVSNAATHRVYQAILNTGQVSVFAGNGTAGYAGDGGPATSAQLNEPAGLAFDSGGNLYIVDASQNVVRKVDTSGNISTFAGNGVSGTQPPSGDGGPAIQAQLSQPVSIAFDSSNVAYLADTGHSRIRQIGTSGIINTVAGASSGDLMLPEGVAVDSTGTVYIADTLHHKIKKLSGGSLTDFAGTGTAGYSGDGGSAISAQFNVPSGIGLDAAGDVYVSDNHNNRIRRIDTSGNITTIAGNGNAGLQGDGGNAITAALSAPSLLTVDRATGDTYFVDSGNQAIRRVSAAAATVTFFPGQSTAAITLTNTGDQTLNITGFNFPAGFTDAGGSCSSLGAGQSCTKTIQSSGNPTEGTLTISSNSATSTGNVFLKVSGGLRFIPVTPCRVADTRVSGGAFSANETRDYDIVNGPWVNCSAPISAGTVQAYSLNVTVVPKGPLPWVTAFPTGIAVPYVSNLNSYDGRIKANAAIVPAGTSGKVSIFAKGATDIVVDLNGYYVSATDPSAPLAFYPVPPCRAIDTRQASGTFGGPSIVGKATGRVFPLVQSACGLPSTAKAFSVNVTAVPRAGGLNYLTLWPSDASQPFVSTLNSPTGTVVANAAIIPAAGDGNGSISAYATENIDLIVDVNGYYAPYQANSGGLSLYNVTPCRVFDTRGLDASNLQASVFGVSSQNVAPPNLSSCTVSASAQSYVLNTTVIPHEAFSYMTNWAHGTSQPLQSTLNAYDSSISSNLAVIPTLDGTISSYTTGHTGLIFDIFGYFAQ